MDESRDGEYRRPQSAQQAVLDRFRYWLLSGRLRPGDQVRQEAVATELHTSVVPVREALKILEAEGQIVHVPRRGFFVARLSRADLLELSEIRSMLETMAVERCLSLIGEEHISRLRRAISAMKDAESRGDIVALVRLDREFHFTIFTAAGESQLTRIISTTWDHSDAYRAAFFQEDQHRRSSEQEHELIVDAVASRDRDQLVALLDRHRLSPLLELPDDTHGSADDTRGISGKI